MTDAPRVGDVLLYPYLWLTQQAAGETEGRKERPTVVALRIDRAGPTGTGLLLVAISSQPPREDQIAIEVPQMELHRAGLDRARPAWAYVSEYNTDVLEQSFYLDRGAEPIGRLSRSFVQQIAGALARTIRERKGRVDRTV